MSSDLSRIRCFDQLAPVGLKNLTKAAVGAVSVRVLRDGTDTLGDGWTPLHRGGRSIWAGGGSSSFLRPPALFRRCRPIYLPALPTMTTYVSTRIPDESHAHTLLHRLRCCDSHMGPLSDRFGRRPVLLVGLTCYTAAGILCAVAPNVFQLMVCRGLQALGAGAATTVATAVVKDAYQGRKREVTIHYHPIHGRLRSPHRSDPWRADPQGDLVAGGVCGAGRLGIHHGGGGDRIGRP